VANLQNKDEGGRLEPEEIVVRRATVDGGMMMKRISPAPMGRAFRIRKRSNHVTIVVAAREEALKPKGAPGARKAPRKSKMAPKAPAPAAKKPAKETKAAKSGAKQKPAVETK
jgi:hypothetical protein